jgi:Uma2 family endonuclease
MLAITVSESARCDTSWRCFVTPNSATRILRHNQNSSQKLIMISQTLEQTIPLPEQRFLLPGYYSWSEFETIEAVVGDSRSLRITYLDGCIELMTVGEKHEMLKKVLAILLETYLFSAGVNFIPVGSVTRRSKEKDVSFEPDESYYIGEKKDHPDLAIEVNITSGSIDKLKKYQRLQITEVWFWEDDTLSLYRLRNEGYVKADSSELLPDLNINLLIDCILKPSVIEARQEFLKGI